VGDRRKPNDIIPTSSFFGRVPHSEVSDLLEVDGGKAVYDNVNTFSER